MVHLTYEEENKGEGVGDGGRKREQEKDEIFYFHGSEDTNKKKRCLPYWF